MYIYSANLFTVHRSSSWQTTNLSPFIFAPFLDESGRAMIFLFRSPAKVYLARIDTTTG